MPSQAPDFIADQKSFVSGPVNQEKAEIWPPSCLLLLATTFRMASCLHTYLQGFGLNIHNSQSYESSQNINTFKGVKSKTFSMWIHACQKRQHQSIHKFSLWWPQVSVSFYVFRYCYANFLCLNISFLPAASPSFQDVRVSLLLQYTSVEFQCCLVFH